MADGNNELKRLRRSVRTAIRPSGLVAVVTFCMTLLPLVVLAACGDGNDALENGETQATPRTGATETRDADGEATAKLEFASVSAGTNHTCGVRIDGAVECWGRDLFGEVTPPPGEFASVSAGWRYTCGVRRDGAVACWGDDASAKAKPPRGS